MVLKKLSFTKMSGSGNDFVIIDHRNGGIPEEYIDRFVKKVCARRTGVGADGLILVENSEVADFRWRFFNADGGEVEMCGNGGRCVARFALEKEIVDRDELRFETLAGIINAKVSGEIVKVELTRPSDLRLNQKIDIETREYTYHFVNTGVPHVILIVEDIEEIDVEDVGAAVRYHQQFKPEGTNANFVKFVDRHNIIIRTYERGVEAETLACGTGSVAAVLVGVNLDILESPVSVKTRGGEILNVYVDGEWPPRVYLEGKVKIVYDGILWNEIFRE